MISNHNSNNRLERLKRIRWDIGVLLPAELKANLSGDELKWFLNYSKNLSEYMGEIEKGSDLTLKRYPPKQLYVQVGALAHSSFVYILVYILVFVSLTTRSDVLRSLAIWNWTMAAPLFSARIVWYVRSCCFRT